MHLLINLGIFRLIAYPLGGDFGFTQIAIISERKEVKVVLLFTLVFTTFGGLEKLIILF